MRDIGNVQVKTAAKANDKTRFGQAAWLPLPEGVICL